MWPKVPGYLCICGIPDPTTFKTYSALIFRAPIHPPTFSWILILYSVVVNVIIKCVIIAIRFYTLLFTPTLKGYLNLQVHIKTYDLTQVTQCLIRWLPVSKVWRSQSACLPPRHHGNQHSIPANSRPLPQCIHRHCAAAAGGGGSSQCLFWLCLTSHMFIRSFYDKFLCIVCIL